MSIELDLSVLSLGGLNLNVLFLYPPRIRAWRICTGWWKCIAFPCIYYNMHESE